jgi:colanic acid/amylovoran biosynthesis glycosyltransferase
MARTLVIFTISYPYGYGDSFLHGELGGLSEQFESIIIQPLNGGELISTPPPWVRVEPPLKQRGSMLFYLVGLLSPSVLLDGMMMIWRARRVRPLLSMIATSLRWARTKASLETAPITRQMLAAPDDYLVYCYWGGVLALATPRLSAHGVPCAVRYHSWDLYEGRPDMPEQPFIPWRVEVAEAADMALFISDHGRAYFENSLPRSAADHSEKMVARLGTADFGEGPAGAGDRLRIVSCSFLVGGKRVPLIARLMRAIARQHPVEWHHFGGGDEEGAVRAALATDCTGLEYKLWGSVPNATITDFYRETHVDLLVNLSIFEGVPVSAMEAISFGIPVAATQVGAVAEVVIPGRSGILIQERELADLDVLAERILAAFLPGGEIEVCDPRAVWVERFDGPRNFAQTAIALRELGERQDRSHAA